MTQSFCLNCNLQISPVFECTCPNRLPDGSLVTQQDSWEERLEEIPNVEVTTIEGNREVKLELKAKFTKDVLPFISSEIERAREEGRREILAEFIGIEKAQKHTTHSETIATTIKESERERIIGVVKRNKRCFYAASNPKLTEECRIWDSALDNLLEELKK